MPLAVDVVDVSPDCKYFERGLELVVDAAEAWVFWHLTESTIALVLSLMHARFFTLKVVLMIWVFALPSEFAAVFIVNFGLLGMFARCLYFLDFWLAVIAFVLDGAFLA